MVGLELEVLTPERTVYSSTVESLRAPGSEGSFGILPRHAFMLAMLDIGPVYFDVGGQRQVLAVSGGFAEVHDNQVVLLVEAAELAEEIDVERAEAARDRARRRLDRSYGMDVPRARAALARALNRLHVAGAG